MRNLKITLEYDGTRYSGWQVQHQRSAGSRQRSAKTIQAAVEKALQKILQEKIRLVVSGRTDAGVHALGQVANFKTKSRVPRDKLRWALNGNLPGDIAVVKIEEADPDFHSRFAAKSKVYRYIILNRAYPSPLLRNRVYFYRHSLNIRLMRQEARVLLGKHNFASFQASDKRARDAVRTLRRLGIRKDGERINIDIEGNGFLYNMVRNIVGTLIEIGRGKLPKGSLSKILAAQDRRLAGPTVPPGGLYLLQVKY